MKQIDKLPIIILSSKRTGSTALMHDIAVQQDNIKIFNEPLFSNDISKLIDYNDCNNNYILKVHAYDFLHEYPLAIKKIVQDHECSLIRIRRKNLVDQVASHYIASQRNIWSYERSINYDNINSFRIDVQRIERSIKMIGIYNDAVSNYAANFDHDLFFEDQKFSASTKYIKTPLPEHYDELKALIKSKLVLLHKNNSVDNKRQVAYNLDID